MARMSIDDMIARDTRIDRLAKLCGWSRRETRACLEDIWALCYDRVVPYLPAEDIEVTALRDAISPPACPEGFIAALRKVGLARDATASDRNFTRKDGTRVPWPDQNWRDRLYMAGAGERVGYLLTKRSAGSEGGIKSGESRRSKTKQSFDSASSKTQARGNPPDPVPDSAPDPVPDQIPEYSPARDQAVREPDATPPPAPILPASRERAELKRRLIGRAWTLGAEAFLRIQAEGIDQEAPNGWSGMPDASSPPMVNLRAILDGLLVGDRPDFEAAEAKIANRIAVAEAEARAMSPASARYMTPARIWNRESFSIAVDLSPEQVRAALAGPRRGAGRAPAKRDVRYGQIQPGPPSDYDVPDGEMPL